MEKEHPSLLRLKVIPYGMLLGNREWRKPKSQKCFLKAEDSETGDQGHQNPWL